MNAREARDAALEPFQTVWTELGFQAVYDDVRSEIPVSDVVWARAGTTLLDGGRQSSLADMNGKRRWTQPGLLWVQVFAPIGDGKTAAYDAADRVVNAYREYRNSTGVWIRNPRLRDVSPSSGAFSQVNVRADFTYDDVR